MGGPWNGGERPRQGSRTDIARLRDLAMSGVPAQDAVMDPELGPTVVRHLRLFNDLRLLQARPRRVGCQISAEVLYGPSAIGKTYAAHAALARHSIAYYNFWSDNGWWDGYTGQPAVMMDDITGSEMPWGQWLKVLDSYPHTAPVKGSCVHLSCTFFIITTNIHPSLWSCSSAVTDTTPLTRRLNIYDMYANPSREDLAKYLDEKIKNHFGL